MSDEKIEVAFTAQLQDLLTGLGKAQSSVKEATEGMTGSVSDLAETFEKMGGAAVALAGVGLAFEALKIGVDYVKEAAEQTRELAESFKNLGYETGASLQDLNAYTMAMEMSGGKVGDLEHLMVGMQRGIKANSAALVANGVAANEAALKGMTFEEYLTKVSHIADEMATPTDREQFLIQALGRSGATAGQQIKELVEHMEAAHKLSEQGGIITDKGLLQLEESKQATARLQIAQQQYAANVSTWATDIGNWFTNAHAGWIQQESDVAEVSRLLQTGQLGNLKYGQSLMDLIPQMKAVREEWAKLGSSDHDVGAGPKPGTQADISDKEIEAQKKAAAERQKAAEAAAKEEERIQEAADESLVREHGEMIKYKANLDKQAAAEAAALAKEGMNQAERDAKVLAENLKAQDKAILAVKEQHLAEWKAKQDAANKAMEDANKRVIKEMTQGWADGLVMMANHQLTFSEGVKGALVQMGQVFEKTMADMAVQWAENQAKNLAISLETHMQKNLLSAKTAAGEAWESAAAIPYVGWIMAPAAAAAAFTGVMAFAEGGWDRVPSDQVAMIHKNEMVLPASIAEPVRQMAAAGGGGGQTVHIHAMDAPSVQALFRRHQGSLMSVIGEAMRNGRTR